MVEREDFLTNTGADTSADPGFGHDRSSDQIRSDIDRTRADMDETFSALESKLTPGQILEEAWGLFKGGSSAGATRLLRVVREHPLPSAVIGLGAGWLLVESSRRSDSYDSGDSDYDRSSYGRSTSFGRSGYGRSTYGGSSYGRGTASYRDYDSGSDWESESSGGALDKVKDVASSARDAVSNAADTVGEKAEHLKDQALDLGHQAQEKALQLKRKAKTQVRRARTGFWQTMEENPLLVGAATLALGIVAGLAIPSTDVEDEWMGETRDQLVDQAKELGQEALDKGKQVAGTVVDKVKTEAENQGLSPQNLADKVKAVAQEATNTAKEEVKKQAPALANAGSDKPGETPAPSAQGQASQPQGQQAAPRPAPPQGQGQQPPKPAPTPPELANKR
jgi:gas vesicle protein